MTWDTNWVSSGGKGKLLKVALNNLRGALDERTSAVGRSVPVNCPVIASNELIPSSWFTAFQSEISTLIPLYINHTDNGGDWDGSLLLSSIAPSWTEGDILSAIGESRLSSPTDPLISATWMYQQYKIINLLRWGSKTGVIVEAFRRTGILQTDTTESGAKTKAENNWDSDSFTPDSGAIDWTSIIYQQSASIFKASLVNLVGKLQATNVAYLTIQASVDFYIYSSASDPFFSATGISEYVVLYGFTEDVFNKYSVIESANEDIKTIELGSRDKQAWLSASLGDDNRKSFQAASGTAEQQTIKSVLKWDGINGFAYKDW